MDGENNGSKPYEQMDDLGGKNPYFWKHPYRGLLTTPFITILAIPVESVIRGAFASTSLGCLCSVRRLWEEKNGKICKKNE